MASSDLVKSLARRKRLLILLCLGFRADRVMQRIVGENGPRVYVSISVWLVVRLHREIRNKAFPYRDSRPRDSKSWMAYWDWCLDCLRRWRP